jgi:hypothetical protein
VPGYQPAALDLDVERRDEAAVRRARFVGFSVPMHTALRVALEAAARVRALNPEAHVCSYGLYAPLNRELLLARPASGASGGGGRSCCRRGHCICALRRICRLWRKG